MASTVYKTDNNTPLTNSNHYKNGDVVYRNEWVKLH